MDPQRRDARARWRIFNDWEEAERARVPRDPARESQEEHLRRIARLRRGFAGMGQLP